MVQQKEKEKSKMKKENTESKVSWCRVRRSTTLSQDKGGNDKWGARKENDEEEGIQKDWMVKKHLITRQPEFQKKREQSRKGYQTCTEMCTVQTKAHLRTNSAPHTISCCPGCTYHTHTHTYIETYINTHTQSKTLVRRQ